MRKWIIGAWSWQRSPLFQHRTQDAAPVESVPLPRHRAYDGRNNERASPAGVSGTAAVPRRGRTRTRIRRAFSKEWPAAQVVWPGGQGLEHGTFLDRHQFPRSGRSGAAISSMCSNLDRGCGQQLQSCSRQPLLPPGSALCRPTISTSSSK